MKPLLFLLLMTTAFILSAITQFNVYTTFGVFLLLVGMPCFYVIYIEGQVRYVEKRARKERYHHNIETPLPATRVTLLAPSPNTYQQEEA